MGAADVHAQLSRCRDRGLSSQPFLLVFSPVGEPRTPKLEARIHNKGNNFRINWIKQDDGGSPIIHYLIHYRAVSTASTVAAPLHPVQVLLEVVWSFRRRFRDDAWFVSRSLSRPQKQGSVWKPEIRVPSSSDYVLLSSLDWNTDYEVQVVAENQRGKSLPAVLSFRTATEPTSTPGTDPQSRKPSATTTQGGPASDPRMAEGI